MPAFETDPRYLIYCWECNVVEIMYPNDRASDAFREAHEAHKDATQLIKIVHTIKIVHIQKERVAQGAK